MMPSASGMPLSTSSFIVSAAVCQPLAARPPKNVFFAASSSVWKGCGSNCCAKALICATSSACSALWKRSPTFRSSRYSLLMEVSWL
jgi:hypothetical protein